MAPQPVNLRVVAPAIVIVFGVLAWTQLNDVLSEVPTVRAPTEAELAAEATDLSEIEADFRKNEVSAKSIHRGRSIRFSGIVSSIDDGVRPIVTVRDERGALAYCWFTESDRNSVSKLSVGATALFRCRIESWFSALTLENCQIL